ncbi:MAG: hypothetical protein O3B68_01185, partial [Planctomycetota bacterium]|nr:hypothetical protein [Planctomycetota bacterium]
MCRRGWTARLSQGVTSGPSNIFDVSTRISSENALTPSSIAGVRQVDILNLQTESANRICKQNLQTESGPESA